MSCYYCRTPASAYRGGVAVCESHARAMTLSSAATAVTAALGAGGALGYFGVAIMHRDPGAVFLACSVGAFCAWLAVMAWRERTR